MRQQMQEQVLGATARLIGEVTHPKRLFRDWQTLLGFQIGWLQPALAEQICVEARVAPDDIEIILMQAIGRTAPHVHMEGASMFQVLGTKDGFLESRGGILQAEFVSGVDSYELVPTRHQPGQIVTVPAGQVHAFYAETGGELAAIGCVYPRIRQGDRFDAVPFQFEGEGNRVGRA